MRESRTFGSVGGEGGNVLAYPAISHCPRRWSTTAESDPDQTVRVPNKPHKLLSDTIFGLLRRNRNAKIVLDRLPCYGLQHFDGRFVETCRIF